MNPAVLTDMIGRLVGDRYRVEDLIGVGSMTAVFRAYDTHEEEWVALKIFDEAIGQDDAYVERLLDVVAQIAVLQHPNVARVTDWGLDVGPYVISELCEGGSLAGLLEAGHRLTASQALVMTLECARALHHGHERGLIHRGVRTTNVLFAEDQRLKLSDHGMAEVLADAPSAQSDLGTVQYISPEQARGRPVGSSSDLYSLALLVNEAVTGTAPTVSETVVGTLMERAETAAVVTSELGALQAPIERCGRLDPTERPEAEELTISLLAAAESMPRPEALPLVGLAHLIDDDLDAFDEEGFAELDPTAAERIEDEDDGPVLASVPEQSAPGGFENLADADPVFSAVEVEDHPDLDIPERRSETRNARVLYEEHEDDADERLPWWPLLILVLLIGGAIAGGVYLLTLARSSSSAAVPNLVGVQIEDLEAQIDGQGWIVQRLEDRSDGSEPGEIVEHTPAAGVELDEGETLTVVVSLGNEMVEIPSDIVGLTVEQAANRLGSVGLTLGDLADENSEQFASGLVIAVDEPTTQKPSGQDVALRISLGPEERIVPVDVVGMSIGEATGLLTGLRLQAVEEPVFDPEVAEGTVLDASPEPGSSLPADSQVTLFVSAGPEPVAMPDLVGLSLSDAIDVIDELGLIYVDVEGTLGEDAIGSLPPAGAIVEIGAEVTVILADSEEDEEDS